MRQIVLVGAENYTLMQVAYGHITYSDEAYYQYIGRIELILEVFGMLWVARKQYVLLGDGIVIAL